MFAKIIITFTQDESRLPTLKVQKKNIMPTELSAVSQQVYDHDTKLESMRIFPPA